MSQTPYFFAADLGATSGRTIVGRIHEGKVCLEEVTRFPNRLIQTGGQFYWDIYALYDEIIRGLQEVARRGLPLAGIGIDTWGVDFVCIGPDRQILRNPRSYRDPHTFAAMDDYLLHQKSKRELYDITGIQLMNFNSIFQLYAMQQAGNAALAGAEQILFMPDALSWMLTGNAVCEYTIASTSELLDPRTGELDETLLATVGLTRRHFGKMVPPGTQTGTLTPEVQKMTGLGPVPVFVVAGHDTGSAIAAVPAADGNFAYLSSGTWSLMGIETHEPIINDDSYNQNLTNEGGIEGTTRFLKNICGMWLLEQCRKEWGDSVPKDYATLSAEAMKVEGFRSLINPDDPHFANPPHMEEAIRTYCRETGQHVPDGYAEVVRCIFDSLAMRYRQVLHSLREFARHDINTLHIIGGGSRNQHLCQFTANATGTRVLAGPQEGTALGNIMVQAKAVGQVKDIWEMRHIVAHSIPLTEYTPKECRLWEEKFRQCQHLFAL